MSLMILPGEVRNLIYAYVFPPVRLLIAIPGEAVPGNQQLCHRLACKDGRAGLKASKNLLLTCREVYEEVRLLLYIQPTFCFDSHKALTLFLCRTPAPSIAIIRKVEFLQNFPSLALAHNLSNDTTAQLEEARWCIAYMEAERLMTGKHCETSS